MQNTHGNNSRDPKGSTVATRILEPYVHPDRVGRAAPRSPHFEAVPVHEPTVEPATSGSHDDGDPTLEIPLPRDGKRKKKTIVESVASAPNQVTRVTAPEIGGLSRRRKKQGEDGNNNEEVGAFPVNSPAPFLSYRLQNTPSPSGVEAPLPGETTVAGVVPETQNQGPLINHTQSQEAMYNRLLTKVCLLLGGFILVVVVVMVVLMLVLNQSNASAGSLGPSPSPTLPSGSPSIQPSFGPTIHPTPVPSSSPTTQMPSVMPSLYQSFTPSIRPTTAIPTASPSTEPTTLQPSTEPSFSPTTPNPSLTPTAWPTTARPSPTPTPLPTTQMPSPRPTSPATTPINPVPSTSVEVFGKTFSLDETVIELIDPDMEWTGPIPTDLVQFTKLAHLWLNKTGLTGQIPSQLGLLTLLNTLGLSNNKLEGVLPTELGQLTQLTVFLVKEGQLTGPIPTELGQLTELFSFFLIGAQMTGLVPSELGLLTALSYLTLIGNNFDGMIPTEICSLDALDLVLQTCTDPSTLECDCGGLCFCLEIGLIDNLF